MRRFAPAVGRARRSIRLLLSNDAAKAEAIRQRIDELDAERAKLVLNVAQQARCGRAVRIRWGVCNGR